MAKRLIALRALRYNHRQIPSGQTFDAITNRDALLLISAGLAHPEPPKRSYRTATVDVEPSVETVEDEPRKKRTYRRRDLTAEASE